MKVPHWQRKEFLEVRKRQSEFYRAKRQALVPAIRMHIEAGITLRNIATLLGVAQSQVSRICLENGIKFPISKGGFVTEQPWQVADISELTEQQFAEADRYGIPPARFAWLLSCPKLTVKEGRLLRK